MRRDRKPDIEYPHGITGERTLQELLAANMLLIPIALDPFGRWGPITQNWLFQTTRNLQYHFRNNKQQAAIMFSKITKHPCPIGILRTADAYWKGNKTRTFYGYSYTSPTPSIHNATIGARNHNRFLSTHQKCD